MALDSILIDMNGKKKMNGKTNVTKDDDDWNISWYSDTRVFRIIS